MQRRCCDSFLFLSPGASRSSVSHSGELGCLLAQGLKPCSLCRRIIKLLSSPPCCHVRMLATVWTMNNNCAQLVLSQKHTRMKCGQRNQKSNFLCYEEQKPWGRITHINRLSKSKETRCLWQWQIRENTCINLNLITHHLTNGSAFSRANGLQTVFFFFFLNMSW